MVVVVLQSKMPLRSAFKELPRKFIKVFVLDASVIVNGCGLGMGWAFGAQSYFCSNPEHIYFDSEILCLQCRKYCESLMIMSLLICNVCLCRYIVLTTSAGIMDHEEARRKHTGGKILGFFF